MRTKSTEHDRKRSTFSQGDRSHDVIQTASGAPMSRASCGRNHISVYCHVLTDPQALASSAAKSNLRPRRATVTASCGKLIFHTHQCYRNSWDPSASEPDFCIHANGTMTYPLKSCMQDICVSLRNLHIQITLPCGTQRCHQPKSALM